MIRILALLLLAATVAHAAPLPPVQPRGTLCERPHFAAALGASITKATAAKIVVTVDPPKYGPMVGQANFPACTGAGWANTANTSPGPRYDFDQADALKFWRTFRNQSPKFKGDDTAGAYVGEVIAVLARRGYIEPAPKTLWNATMLARWLATEGPCLLSIPIYFDMYFPDAGSFIHPTGEYVGDHMLLAIAYDPKTKVFTLGNSWTDFPPYARFKNIVKVTFKEMELLHRWGGQGIGVKKRKPKVP